MIKSRWLSEPAYIASSYAPKHDSMVPMLDERHWLFLSCYLRCLNYLSGLGKPNSLNRKRVFLAWSRGCGGLRKQVFLPGRSRALLLSSFFSLMSFPLSLSCVRKIWVRMRDCVTGLPSSVSERGDAPALRTSKMVCHEEFRRTFCLPLDYRSLTANMPSSHAHILTQRHEACT